MAGSAVYIARTFNRTVSLVGIPAPGISCKAGHTRGVVCPIYLDDSGSAIIAASDGSPETYVQLAEVSIY